MTYWKHRCLLACALAAGASATVVSGASAAGWLPPVNVSPVAQNATKFDPSLQDVAVDEQGNVVAAWIQPRGGAEIVEAATRPVGGKWSSQVAVSPRGEDALALKVVVDPDGNAAAIWIGVRPESKQLVRVARRPSGGGWSEPVALTGVEGYATDPDIAIDGDGNLTAVWCEETEPGKSVVRAASRPADGDWSTPVDLSDDSLSASSSQVAVDPQGNATALWLFWNDANRTDGIVQTKTRPADGEWTSEPVNVSGDDGLASYPQLAVDAQGGATAVWWRYDIPAPSGFHQFVQTARRTGGTWSSPVTLSSDDDFAYGPAVTVDRQGKAIALWSALTDGPRLLQTRSRAADGTWGSPANLASGSGFDPGDVHLQLAADPQGNVTATWSSWVSPTLVVRSARRTAAGTWGPAVDLSTGSAYSAWPRTAVDQRGYATVVWSGLTGTQHAVRSRVFDPVAPELRDLEVPADGVVGQPVTMSVDPFDVWSAVTTSWQLGDGGSAAAATVSHCYSTPGTRTVTVTGADVVANVASASRTIEIAPNPDLPAGVDPCSDPGPGPNPGPGPGPGPGPAPVGPGPQTDPPAGTSRSCTKAKKSQKQLKTKVKRAKKKQRAAESRAAKRKWRVVVKRREAALRKATKTVKRTCR